MSIVGFCLRSNTPVRPLFTNDELEALVRRCVVFPANGSEACIVPMVARTVTAEDTALLAPYSRCVDMASTFGDDYRKTQVSALRSAQDGVESTYLFFYNLSPNLRINLSVAQVVGVTPSHLKSKRRLFWRGDVVAMKVQPQSEQMDFIVKSLDADLSELGILEMFLKETYRRGNHEHLLAIDEFRWNYYVSRYCKFTSLLFGPPVSYWGANAAEKEGNFLNDLNELRCTIGRPPLPRHVYMKSFIEHAITLYTSFKYLFRQKTPKLPPQLERRIFETCALESPETCTTLILVAKRVHAWIDPILLSTVCITEGINFRRRDRPERFLAKLNNGKPVEYYAQSVKNMAIIGPFFQTEVINRIIATCTGVENLALLAPACNSDFFEIPQATRNIRRLSIRLENASPQFDFHHSCFANLTHLHLWDEYWFRYTGWEALVNLTHLGLADSGYPPNVIQLMKTLPTIRYVALGSYHSGEEYRYADVTVDNSSYIRAAWGVRVVVLSKIPVCDWERGARGQGDFWDVVEREVEKRLQEGSIE
ncbi:hypothetical protein AX15_005811 [Amanita polypyramis BW_CC]|nr:hypothetical protein AX15_005811 [Amanita polypyramis BW_CC]